MIFKQGIIQFSGTGINIASASIRQRTLSPLAVTQSDMDLYIDADNGSDSYNGTSTYPFQTFMKALSYLPKYIGHKVHIRYSGGTYTAFPRIMDHHIHPDGQLTFECTDEPTTLSGPHTITSHISHPYVSNQFTVSGAGWTPGEWRGKFIKVEGTDYMAAIYDNTADSIHLNPSFTFPTIGKVITIVDPAAEIITEYPVTFDVDGTLDWEDSQFGIANTAFTSSDGPYIWKGDVQSILACCRFTVSDGENAWIHTGGSINVANIRYSVGFDEHTYRTYEQGCIQFCNESLEHTTDQIVIFEPGKNALNDGVNLNFFSCLGGLLALNNNCTVQYAIVDHIKVDHTCDLTFLYGSVWPESSDYCILIADGAMFECGWVFIEDIPLDCIVVEDFGRGKITNITSNSDATRYVYNLDALARLTLNGADIEGAVADIYFQRDDSTHSQPADGASANDGEDSWVIVKS